MFISQKLRIEWFLGPAESRREKEYLMGTMSGKNKTSSVLFYTNVLMDRVHTVFSKARKKAFQQLHHKLKDMPPPKKQSRQEAIKGNSQKL